MSEPPLIVPLEELFPGLESDFMLEKFHEILRKYRATLPTDRKHLLEQFQITQIARKVVGVGSVGTRCWIILLQGPRPEDVLFLQAKEAEASVLERFTKKSAYANHGARVVAGQRLMQASSDIFLGWQRTDGIDGVSRDYYVRQLQDWKGSVDVENAIPRRHGGLRRHVRQRAGPGARPLGRPHRHRVLSRQQPVLREGARPASPSAMPTRTSATTRPSPRRAARAGSTPRKVSEASGTWAGPGRHPCARRHAGRHRRAGVLRRRRSCAKRDISHLFGARQRCVGYGHTDGAGCRHPV